MATTKKTDVTEITGNTEASTVEIEKDQLDKLLEMYDELKEIKQSLKKNNGAEKLKQDKEIAEFVKKKNSESDELVEFIAPLGSMRSNKNLEVNLNGVQYTIPRGVKCMIPKKVVEIIENSIRQTEIAFGVQLEAAKVAAQAIDEHKI